MRESSMGFKDVILYCAWSAPLWPELPTSFQSFQKFWKDPFILSKKDFLKDLEGFERIFLDTIIFKFRSVK